MISIAPLDLYGDQFAERSVNRGGVAVYETSPGVLEPDYRAAGGGTAVSDYISNNSGWDSLFPTLVQAGLTFLQTVPSGRDPLPPLGPGNPVDILFPPTVQAPGYPEVPTAGTYDPRFCPPGKKVQLRQNASGDLVLSCRKRPRMNMLNPDALKRSVRRLAGFQDFATKTERAIQASFRKAGVKPARRSFGGCGTCGKKKCGC